MGSFNVKRMAKTIAFLVVIAAVVGGSKIGYDYLVVNGPLISEARQLDARLEQAAKLGLAVSPEEIDNAERLKGIELYDEFMQLDAFLSQNKAILDNDKNLAAIDKLMRDNPSQLANLEQAANLGNVNVPVEWNRGLANHPPNYTTFNRYVDVACNLAKASLDKGNVAESVKYIAMATKITASLTDEPLSGAYVSWASCSNKILRTAFLMAETKPRDAQLIAGLKAAALAVEPPKNFVGTIRGDCLLFLVTAKEYDSMGEEKQRALQLADDNKRVDPPQGKFAGSAIQSKSLGFWISTVEVATPKDGNVQNAGYVLDELGAQWVLEDHPANYLAGALPMTYEQLGTSIMRSSQVRNLVLCSFGILDAYHQTGSLPQSLPKDDPYAVDPFTGKPLLYKPGNGQFSLQALGDVEPKDARPSIGNLRLVQGQGYGLVLKL